jgi:hypothetical protein
MRPTHTLGAALTGVVILAGCVAGGTVSTTTSTTRAPTTSSVSASTLPPVVECPGTGEFGEGSGIADIEGESDADSSHLRRISWETSDRCETFIFDFETSEGAPAISVPNVRVDHLDTFQVIRIEMDIDSATLTDQLVETALVDRLYVVKALAGTMFVDLHLKEPAAARARVESAPARLVLDLKPGLVPFAGASIVDDEVVVVSPGVKTGLAPVTRLQGYSSTTEGEVLVVVTQGDQVLVDRTTPVAESSGWGEFLQDIALDPGEWLTFVGRPTEDGFSGVQFELSTD